VGFSSQYVSGRLFSQNFMEMALADHRVVKVTNGSHSHDYKASYDCEREFGVPNVP
jgi:hypothetical protein